MEIQKISLEHTQKWFTNAYDVFKTQAWILIGFFILATIVSWVVGMVPILGFPVSYVISILLSAGELSIGKKAIEKTPLKLSDLFEAFNNNCAPLVILCIVTLLLYVSACVPAFIGGAMAMFKSGALSMSLGIIMGTLLSAGIFMVVFMSAAFAVPLVYFKKLEVTKAMKLSFQACNKNMWSLTWFSLIWLGLALLCTLTLGVGFLVLFPITKIALYYAYTDIFKEQTFNTKQVSDSL